MANNTIQTDIQLTEIKGEQLIQSLLNGYKIIWFRHDGFDWHVLLEQTDKTKEIEDINYWHFLYFETLNHSIKSDNFSHMSSYRNQTRRSVIKKVYMEYIGTKIQKGTLH